MPRLRFSDDAVIGLVTGVVYLILAFWLAGQDLIFPDTLSRVANGYYVVFSRDPHLAAIGFVWNPLPSLASIPLLLATPLFPALAAKGLAGSIISAVCGAMSMVLARRILTELGAGRAWALTLTVILAIQPLVLLSSATGASEAMLLTTCLYATLRLVRWLTEDDPWHLIHTGLALGLGYLVRYETAAAALAVTILVLIVSLSRSRTREGRGPALALIDGILVAGPFAAAFFSWALASRLIVGSWFATYTSQYGNSAQVSSARESIDMVTGGWGGAATYAGIQLLAVAPLAPPLILIAAVVALLRRDPRVLAPAAVLGSVLAFDEAAFLGGSSFGWLRFQFMAIPWGILMGGYVAGILLRSGGRHGLRRVIAGVLLVGLAAQIVPAWWASTHPLLAREETFAQEVAAAGQYRVQAEVAAYLDSLDLPNGSVITDVAYSFPIVLASSHPHQFVITPDRDFPEKLRDPVAGGVRYALVTQPKQSSADAVTHRFPQIYENGAGVATLVKEWSDGRGARWRIYAFNGS